MDEIKKGDDDVNHDFIMVKTLKVPLILERGQTKLIERNIHLVDVATPYEYEKVKIVEYLDNSSFIEINTFHISEKSKTVGKAHRNSFLKLKM